MKLLTVAIPCYNSEEYMDRSIRSAIQGGDRVEVIIVDDGSTDNTLEIAKKYEKKFPNIVRVIHQENGGHGEAVNTGIKNAKGLYFKVLDSDDQLGRRALQKVLDLLEEMVEKDEGLDMLISNFVYDKQGAKHKKVMRYKSAMPVNRIFGWDDLKLGFSQFILMHSVIYRTKVLRKSGMRLPKHTFYVDNIYVFQPFPYVEKIYYLDVVLYKYFIGRDDQSVNEEVMIRRLDQQYRVTKLMIDIYTESDIKNKKLDKAMTHYFMMMMVISSVFSIREGTKERLKDKKELWKYLQDKNPKLYKNVKRTFLGWGVNLPTKVGRGATVTVYKISQKIVGFN
ncbi:MAG: glycosyltransferase family 2 protein [Eubacterium sp.]|nr:glycosyltransferase family 2 protein [Eubacterium sp.]